MGLFGGKSEEDLRESGTPTTARVTYADDTGKRREDGRQAKLQLRVQLDSGAARGREMEQAKWVPADRPPRVGDHVQIRFDPDDIDDWAWGDPAMYGLATPPPAALAALPIGFQGSGIDIGEIQQMIATAFEQGNVTFDSVSQMPGRPPRPGRPADTAGLLRRLDDLLEQKILTEAEHREQRQRIIDSI